jgi:UDP-N-acetylmuramate--alanine ligase
MHYHFIGIGGIGMSALARILIDTTWPTPITISGSDLRASAVTAALQKKGVLIYIGHSASHLPAGATVVYSTDIRHDNPEYAAAIAMRCPMLHRADLLAQLMNAKEALIVAGTHGKTTTTALLTWLLLETGQQPSYAIGGVLPKLQTNAAAGSGPLFVAEADESDGSFCKYRPFGAIVTNIGLDHMNHFVTEEALVAAFKEMMATVRSPQHLFWCGDDERLSSLAVPGISYGFGDNCDLHITHYEQNEWMLSIDLSFRGTSYSAIEVPLVGRHNALNVSAVFGMGLALGLDEKAIRAGLLSFVGVHRRCENKGSFKGALFLDDYAHHPTEIRTTLHGIRSVVGNRRLIAVYQPHRYTRVRDCLGLFSDIFNCVDELLVTDIYGAGEPVIAGITHQNVISEVAGQIRTRHVARQELAQNLLHMIQPNDVVVSLGAGDITHLAQEMEKAIGQK